MPELPEVETIRRQLLKYLPMKIEKSSHSKEAIKDLLHTPFKPKLPFTLVTIERRGKMLIFKFDNQQVMLSHLGMTGTWRISEAPLIDVKHQHIKLVGLDRENRPLHLTYVDPRRFGHIYLLSKSDADQKIAELGVDLASPDFTLEYITQSLKRYPERALKVTLLDQSLFAGSGNYIANEICALAGILPTRQCKNIKKNEFKKIHEACLNVITNAISTQGVTFQGGYQDAFGEKGEGVSNLVVFYQKICQMCKKSEVIKINLAQRGTYYCPRCQK
jgi:formamidopyrimidine-DNA glycosylase